MSQSAEHQLLSSGDLVGVVAVEQVAVGVQRHAQRRVAARTWTALKSPPHVLSQLLMAKWRKAWRP
jgi:hypothetical protein